MSLDAPHQSLRPGFAEPVRDAQRVFKAVMRAMSRPGSVVELARDLTPPQPLTPEVASVLLALGDHETQLWLGPSEFSADAATFLTFHTGVRVTGDIAAAAFVLANGATHLPDFATLAQGTPEYPDRSATLLVPVAGFRSEGLQLSGPGIDGAISFGFDGMPAAFADAWARNHDRYPCGIDIIFTAPGAVAALPRSTRIVSEA